MKRNLGQDRQKFTFHGTADSKETLNSTTPQHKHQKQCTAGVFFWSSIHVWPLKAPGCTLGEGRQAPRQPSDSSIPKHTELVTKVPSAHALSGWSDGVISSGRVTSYSHIALPKNNSETRLRNFTRFAEASRTLPNKYLLEIKRTVCESTMRKIVRDGELKRSKRRDIYLQTGNRDMHWAY